jgi:hypothetical protein
MVSRNSVTVDMIPVVLVIGGIVSADLLEVAILDNILKFLYVPIFIIMLVKG